jgi:hypothetical protein
MPDKPLLSDFRLNRLKWHGDSGHWDSLIELAPFEQSESSFLLRLIA